MNELFFSTRVLAVGGWVAAAALLAACGGAIADDTAGAAGAGGAATASAGSGGSVAKAGGSGGVAGQAPVATPCVPQPDGSTVLDPTCNDLDVMTVAHPYVVDASGGGTLSPGSKATLHVDLQEIAGRGFNVYPGVHFTSDHPGVAIKEDDWAYAILACQTHPFTATVTVDASVAKGTKVMLTSHVAMLGEDCPSAPSVALLVSVD